jgi:hypothetical protein
MNLNNLPIEGTFIEAEGGFYSGKLLVNGKPTAVITAPKALGEFSGIWLPEYTLIPGANSFNDGVANTLAMAEAGSPIAQKAIAAEINGHKDWVIGARDVVELQYRHLKPTTDKNYVYRHGDNPSSIPVGYPYSEDEPAQTPLALFQAGGTEAFEPAWYATSTQSGANVAWFQGFRDGYQFTGLEYSEFQVRLVRLIQLDA